jgi:hypothetical protein
MNRDSNQSAITAVDFGSGTRLWQLPRAGYLKQFVVLQVNASLLPPQEVAEDFVGLQRSARVFVRRPAAERGLIAKFRGESVDEVGIGERMEGDEARCKPGGVIVKVDQRYFRPTKVETLLGGPSESKLDWKPAPPSPNWCGRRCIAVGSRMINDLLLEQVGV